MRKDTIAGGGLTERRLELLRYLVANPGATYTEMAAGLGIKGKHGPWRLLEALERHGWVKRARFQARGVSVLRLPPEGRPMSREQGLAHARAWRKRMKPVFDRMDAEGQFAPSPLRRGPYARRISDA